MQSPVQELTAESPLNTPFPMPARNLSAYANVFPDRQTKEVVAAALEMNFVDKAAYSHLVSMEQEVVGFLLSNLHDPGDAEGFATSGSSEAIVLALAYHQQNFVNYHPHFGKQKLNFVVSKACHKVFEKYAQLFGTELRPAALNKDLTVDVNSMQQLIDDKTFCLIGIAGSTETGKMDNIASIDKLARKCGIPVHVDAAIGGYVFPFLKDNFGYWDFSLPSVKTINISGHKYGLCVPSIGFLLLGDRTIMPKHYREESTLAYMSGGAINDFALTCSRNAAFVVNAHHNFTSFGKSGYSELAEQNQLNKAYLAENLQNIRQISQIFLGDAPVVNFSGVNIGNLSKSLTAHGWIQHPHPLPDSNTSFIRVALRKHITRQALDALTEDIANYYSYRAMSTRS